MFERVTCPSCRVMLLVPDENGRTFTCPRCLGAVPAPGTEHGIQTATAVSKRETGITVEQPATERRCPGCGEPVQAQWAACPYCGYYITSEAFTRKLNRSFELDVRRDNKTTSGGMIALAAIGAVVIVYSLVAAITSMTHTGDPTALLQLLIGLGFLTLIGSAFAFDRNKGNPESTGIGRVVGETLKITGVLFVSVVAFGCAAIIVFFAVCFAAFGFR